MEFEQVHVSFAFGTLIAIILAKVHAVVPTDQSKSGIIALEAYIFVFSFLKDEVRSRLPS